MSDQKTGVWDAESWRVYRRLLGYSARHWPIGLIALVGMLLDGVNHIAWISKDVGRLGRFYERVFDADTAWNARKSYVEVRVVFSCVDSSFDR